jgi:ribonuclease E
VPEKVLLVNADEPEEVRVALLEDGRLEEIYVETGPDPSGKGNVYAARVQNVEKGMGAAFVDLGGGRTGFLHVSDLVERPAPKAPEAAAPVEGGEPPPPATPAPPAEAPRIQDLLQPGQDLLVQVSRGPVGQKGPTVTTRISLPGRFVVLLVNSTRSGVSRRLDPEGRDRARAAARDLTVPEGMGTILRTAGLDRPREELQADLDALVALWESLRARLAAGTGPRLVHAESDLALRAGRDLLPADATRIVVDRPELAVRVREYLAATAPSTAAAVAVEAHEGPTPLFHAWGVEDQVEEAFRRTVRLPSGGSIVIDPTEALVAVDVNSGRMTGEEDLETTALRTDLEAAAAVARQLRLRDLGGVIVVDFIDLRDPEHVRRVEQAFREALQRDRARLRLGRIGPFGCLEMTRQRLRPPLSSVTHAPCPSCGGTGRRRIATGLALRVLREMRARAARSGGRGGIDVRVPPAVADVLRTRKGEALAALEASLSGPLRLRADATLPAGGWAMRGLPPSGEAPAPGVAQAGAAESA